MEAGVYINFSRESKEVIQYYGEVFGTKSEDIMTYGQMPADPNFAIADEYKDYVLNASLVIHGMTVMFSDVVPGMGYEYKPGNNISMVISTKDEAILTKEFEMMAKDGTVTMPLEATFWSKKFGSLVDKYGIEWQFNLAE